MAKAWCKFGPPRKLHIKSNTLNPSSKAHQIKQFLRRVQAYPTVNKTPSLGKDK